MNTSNETNVTNTDVINTETQNLNGKELPMNTPNQTNALSASINAVNNNEELLMNTIPSVDDVEIDMDAFFADISLFSDTGTLSSATSAELAYKRKLASLGLAKNVVRNIEKTLSVTRAVHIIQNMGDLNELRNHFLHAVLTYTSYWGEFKKGTKTTHGRIFYTDLLKVVSKDSIAARNFVEATKWLRENFTLEAEEGKELIAKPKTNVSVQILRTGVGISLDRNNSIKPTNGKDFVFKNKTSAILTSEVLNKHLVQVLRNIHIHNEFKVQDSGPYGKEYTTYRKDRLSFRRADILGLLLVLKANKIDISELFESQEKGTNKSLVLVRKEDGSLERMYVPGYTFSEIYGNTGVVSLTEARQGFVSPKITIPRLVEFYSDNNVDYVATRENVNKTINRADKLHDKDGWKTTPVKMIIINDSTLNDTINEMFLTGCAFMTTEWLLKYGACRIITDMDEGGIKAATHPLSDIDPELDEAGYSVVGASAFKGGLLAAIGLATGNPNLIANLSALVAEDPNSTLVLQKIQYLMNKELKTYIVAGQEVRGIEIEVPLTITNAYSVEKLILNPKYDPLATLSEEDKALALEAKETELPDMDKVQKNIDNLESEIETGKRSINGLRDKVMNRVITEPEFRVSDWMKAGLTTGELKHKPQITRIIAQEIQSIAVWHGKDIATDYLRALLQNQARSMDESKVLAAQWLTGNENINHTVPVWKIAETLQKGAAEESFELKAGSPVYPYPVLAEIVSMLNVDEELAWVGVEYPDGNVVSVPCGNILVNDFFEQDPTSYVVAKGLLNELLENIKDMMKEDGSLFEESLNSKYMAATIQRPLLGKNFGYQYTKGMYGVMLPLFGNHGLADVAVTQRDSLEASDRLFVRMNGAKPPQLFRDSTAGYKVFRKTFGSSELDLVMSCAVFVTVEATMILQNDHDGDLFRLSADGYNLPLFTGPAESFNGKFFTDFLVDERAGNKLTIKQAQLSTMADFHREVYNAVEAKGKVGQYTANKYFYEAALSNVRDFVGTDGVEYTINSYDTYVITAILSQLVQMEAMDNIKQEGSDVFVTDLVLYWKLCRIKGFNGVSDEEALEKHLAKAVAALSTLSNTYDMSLSEDTLTRYVEAMVYAARNFNQTTMPAFTLMNARAINEKNFVDISKTLDGENTNDYNFYDSYDFIMNSEDQESIYFHIVKETITTIFG